MASQSKPATLYSGEHNNSLYLEEYGVNEMINAISVVLAILFVLLCANIQSVVDFLRKSQYRRTVRKSAKLARKAERERKAVKYGRALPQKQKITPTVLLQRWFSIKIFLTTLALTTGTLCVGITNRVETSVRTVSHDLGLFMIMGTAMVTLLAFISITDNNWRPDERTFSQRQSVSGRAWVTIALAMIPVNVFLLFL